MILWDLAIGVALGYACFSSPEEPGEEDDDFEDDDDDLDEDDDCDEEDDD